MNKEDKKLLKGALESSLFNQYRGYGSYFNARIVNIKVYKGEGIVTFDRILQFENEQERSNDREISIYRAKTIIKNYKKHLEKSN